MQIWPLNNGNNNSSDNNDEYLNDNIEKFESDENKQEPQNNE